MRILALDTSGQVASVAILINDKITAQYSINHNMTHSVTMMPMLESIMKLTGIELNEIDAIAIAAGPGSFTGLKIGSATAKGLAYALDIPIIPVPTTMALASNLFIKDGLVCPIMDARRERVYSGLYRFADYKMSNVMPQEIYTINDMISEINKMAQPVIFLGDGVPVYKEIIDKDCTVQYHYAPENLILQNAASVAICGRELYEQGIEDTANSHRPIYIRESSATIHKKGE